MNNSFVGELPSHLEIDLIVINNDNDMLLCISLKSPAPIDENFLHIRYYNINIYIKGKN